MGQNDEKPYVHPSLWSLQGASPPATGPEYQGVPEPGMAPRTFEVIQREKQRGAGERLLGAFDKDAMKKRSLTAEAMRMGIEGSPAGGARTAAARRAAAEAGLSSETPIQRAQAELGLLETERSLGNLESDRLMKIMKAEEWIMGLKEAGYGGLQLEQIIKAFAAQQTDPDVQAYLANRATGGYVEGAG